MSKTSSMFLISVGLQKSRSAKNPDKPGVVFIKITKSWKNEDGVVSRVIRGMNTSLTGTTENYINTNTDAIIQLVRLAYCVIEKHADTDDDVSVDEVMADFRKAVNGDSSMEDSVERAKDDFPLRTELVNLGDDLKRFFKFDYALKNNDNETLLGFMEARAIQFKNDGKVAAARSYLSTKNSLARYIGDSQVKLGDIDRGIVEGYSQWLTKNGVSENAQSFYLRTLRSALNHASDAGLISIPDNLFEGLNTKVLIPSHRKNGSGIDKTILQKIATIDLSNNPEAELARDMYMFSFYCHGMELVDVLNLKKKDIKEGNLIFQRRQKGTPRKVHLDQGALDIINKYDSVTETFIFPPMERYLRSQHFTVTYKIRNSIKLIGQQVGYPELTFSSNITSWQKIMSQISLSNILFGHQL